MARRPRGGAEKRSSAPKKEPYPTVLIVCEGERTEPDYLFALKQELRLSSANIAIVGRECGSSPATVVQYAIDKCTRDGGYDHVYCVFDRDVHPDYEVAKNRCRTIRRAFEGKKVSFAAITSNPCFEYWLLLHFVDTSRPFMATQQKSCGDQAVHLLREEYPAYRKADGAKVYAELRDRLDLAIERADRINRQQLENPHTRVPELIRRLREIQQIRESSR